MPPDPDRSRAYAIWVLLVRSGAIVLIGAALGLVVNALHPMGLPLTLGEVQYVGVPRWVWEALEKAKPEPAHRLWQDGSVIVVDVRDAEEFAQAHIPGSINLPYHDFTSAYPGLRDRLPTDGLILLYCHQSKCPLSVRVAKRLLTMGYGKLTVLDGGVMAWRNAGFELEVASPSGTDAPGGEGE